MGGGRFKDTLTAGITGPTEVSLGTPTETCLVPSLLESNKKKFVESLFACLTEGSNEKKSELSSTSSSLSLP